MDSLKVRKRDSTIVKFDINKIKNAIFKASLSTLKDPSSSKTIAQKVSSKVVKDIKLKRKKVIDVEEIQDIVETALMREGWTDIAKNYILYRTHRASLRSQKKFLYGVRDDLKLSLPAIKILQERYLLKDEKGEIKETPKQCFYRTAYFVSRAEKKFKKDVNLWRDKFFKALCNLEFLPNSPTLMNASTSLGQLSACFVLPIYDSIESIFQTLKDMALIHQSGGGTGFSFSRLRPKGDIVTSTKGYSSGPVSFIRIFNEATNVIMQGGKRRGANMGILSVYHPDILEFIESKNTLNLENFNLSVGVDSKFFKALFSNKCISLVNPRTSKSVKSIKASLIFDNICKSAWSVGDPGLIFLDTINRKHPLKYLGKIEATNPCGELPLLPYESCNLGSINLSKIVENGKVNWCKLEDLVFLGVRFLDDVIEVNRFPLDKIEEATLKSRKIGLGVMGFADMLILLGIPYDSQQAVRLARKLMRFIREKSIQASTKLAHERGVFSAYRYSIYSKKGIKLRNATLNSIAPTGSISIIASCSSGIEPLFSPVFIRTVLGGEKILQVDPVFEKIAKLKGFFSRDMIYEIAQKGSLQNIKGIPSSVKRLFRSSLDIHFSWHLKIQKAFQDYVDNSVSKTINLPSEATVEDIKNIYLQAFNYRLKGVTVFRYGCRFSPISLIEEDNISFLQNLCRHHFCIF